MGSNHRPSDYESPALTTELRAPAGAHHGAPRRRPGKRGEHRGSGDRGCRLAPSCSGGETRTLDLAVNSRMLCQLSYPGRPRPEPVSEQDTKRGDPRPKVRSARPVGYESRRAATDRTPHRLCSWLLPRQPGRARTVRADPPRARHRPGRRARRQGPGTGCARRRTPPPGSCDGPVARRGSPATTLRGSRAVAASVWGAGAWRASSTRSAGSAPG